MNIYTVVPILAFFVGCSSCNKKNEPSIVNSNKSQSEFWIVEKDAITAYPNANWYAASKEDSLNESDSEIITLFYPRKKIFSITLNKKLDDVYNNSSSRSEGNHYDSYVSQPPVVKFGVFDNESNSWYMLVLDNVSKDRFVICECNKSQSSFESVLAEIPPYRESRDPEVVKLLLVVLAEYSKHPELWAAEW